MPSLLACPNCGEFEYHKSHSRNIFERIRKTFLHQRPYRCHNCNFRGWILIKVATANLSTKNVVLYFSVLIISIVVGLIVGSSIN